MASFPVEDGLDERPVPWRENSPPSNCIFIICRISHSSLPFQKPLAMRYEKNPASRVGCFFAGQRRPDHPLLYIHGRVGITSNGYSSQPFRLFCGRPRGDFFRNGASLPVSRSIFVWPFGGVGNGPVSVLKPPMTARPPCLIRVIIACFATVTHLHIAHIHIAHRSCAQRSGKPEWGEKDENITKPGRTSACHIL